MKRTQFNCPVEATLSLIGGKYKRSFSGTCRPAFALYGVTAADSSAHPKCSPSSSHDLEGCGMIHREVIRKAAENSVFPDSLWGKPYSRHRCHVSMGNQLHGWFGRSIAVL